MRHRGVGNHLRGALWRMAHGLDHGFRPGGEKGEVSSGLAVMSGILDSFDCYRLESVIASPASSWQTASRRFWTLGSATAGCVSCGVRW